jgi:hypothetical protein
MNLSLHEDTSISNDQKKKYFTLIAEYTLLGLYQLVGLALWGWGMTGGMGSMDLVWALVFIRTGECVAQSHVAFSSIFVKHIKEFKFPRKKKEPVNQIVRLNELFSNQDRGDNSTPTMVTPRATVTTLHKGSNRPSLAL